MARITADANKALKPDQARKLLPGLAPGMLRISLPVKARAVGRPDGFALLSVLLLSFVLLAMIAAWVSMIMIRGKRASLEQERLQAEFTARSGVVKTLWYLSHPGAREMNFNGPSDWEESLFPGGGCRIKAGFEHGYLKIAATGKSGDAVKTESCRCGLDPDSLFKPALAVADVRGVILGSGSEITGDIAAAGGVTIRSGTHLGNVLKISVLPPVQTKYLDQSIAYFQELISRPDRADLELFSPQVFDDSRPLPAKRIYVNDNVLITGSSAGQSGIAGPVIIISTADIQVSGRVTLTDATLAAAGRISVLDNARIIRGDLFSPVEISLAGDSRIEGRIFSLCDVTVSDRARCLGASLVFSAGQPRGAIEMRDQAYINGTLVSLAPAGKGNGIYLDERAGVSGVVYSVNNAGIDGLVKGAVIAGRLYARGRDTVQNNEVRGQIDRSRMPDLALPVIFGDSIVAGWIKPVSGQ